MTGAHHVGRDDETEILAAVDVVEEYFFVGRPCAAGDENGVPLGEAFDEREGTCGATDVDDAVETGVAGDGDVVGHADARKEFDGKAVWTKMVDARRRTGTSDGHTTGKRFVRGRKMLLTE